MHSFQIEPFSDFSAANSRAAMKLATDAVSRQLGGKYPLVINNQAITPGTWIDSINPAQKTQVVGHCARATTANAEAAIAAAKAAFGSWRDTEPKRRAQYLFDAANLIRKRRFEFAAWQVYECGKQWREADADVCEAIDFCDFYAHEMIRLSRPRLRNVPGEDNSYFYEPRGVVVVIAPWNFPLAILCGMTTAALVTGNTVIMKPAEQSGVTAAKLMEVFQQVGLPPGVLSYLPGVGEEIGPTLVGHPDTSLIAFTGSLSVGLLINQQAAVTPPGQTFVKRVIAEMGGKNAIIVDDDADMDEAVVGVVESAFGYQGQKCSACSRVIVPASKYDGFLSRLVAATKSLTIGPATDPAYFLGAVIDEDAFRRLNEAIVRGKAEARTAFAGEVGALVQQGYYVAPHIFADVNPKSFLAQQEFFGPILAVMRSHSLDEALTIANDVPYALTGGLYSRSPANIARVKREFRVGNLYINRKITGALVDRQPFGGFKLSGIGSKAGGSDYLLQFVLPRTITESTIRRGFAPAPDVTPEATPGSGH